MPGDDGHRRHARRGGREEREPLLVTEPLKAFLDAEGLGEGELEISPVGEGHSNVTYAIRAAATPSSSAPPTAPPLPPSAHDVLREARVLNAVGRACARRACSPCATTSR